MTDDASTAVLADSAKKVVSYDCKQCHQSFSNKTQLAKHMFLHREGFICPYCNKPFASESGLKRHWNANHKSVKPSPQCDICGEKFNQRRDVEKHHLICHRADKHFKCKFCGVKFSWITNLKKHESSHSKNEAQTAVAEIVKEKEDKPEPQTVYQCHICKKTFNYDFTYAIHLEGHNTALLSNDQPNSAPLQNYQPNQTVTEAVLETNETPLIPVEVIIEVVPSDDPDKSQAIVSIETLPENQQMKNFKVMKEDPAGVTEKTLNPKENKELLEFLRNHKQRRDEQMKKKLKKKTESAIYDCIMTEEKPFKCETCGESFRWRISLEIHEQLHAKGKTLKIRKPYVKHRKPKSSNNNSQNTAPSGINNNNTTKSKGNVKPDYDKNKYKIIYHKESDEDNDDDDGGSNDEDGSDEDGDKRINKSTTLEGESMEESVNDDTRKSATADKIQQDIKPNSLLLPENAENSSTVVDNVKKFTKKLSNLFMGTKNAIQRIETPKDVIGQLVLLNSADSNVSLDGSKVVSADGMHYIINNGFLYPIESDEMDNDSKIMESGTEISEDVSEGIDIYSGDRDESLTHTSLKSKDVDDDNDILDGVVKEDRDSEESKSEVREIDKDIKFRIVTFK